MIFVLHEININIVSANIYYKKMHKDDLILLLFLNLLIKFEKFCQYNIIYGCGI